MKNQNIAFRLKKRELDYVSTEQERIKLLEELVRLNPKDEIIKKPSFVATWTKFDYEECNVVDINSPTDIGEEVYRLLNIMRIYCFKDGETDGDPLIFSRNQEITVEDFGKKLGLSKIKGVKIFGSSNTYNGRMVGLDYRLSDGERVSFR